MPVQFRNPGDVAYITSVGPRSLTTVARAVMRSNQ